MNFVTAKQRNSQEYRMAMRNELLAMAGIDVAEQARGIQKAWKRLNLHLHSRKTELVTHNGEYVRVILPDNPSQLRAAEAILHMTGANATKQEGESGDVIVNITFPAACQPTIPLDITPDASIQIVQADEQAPACFDSNTT